MTCEGHDLRACRIQSSDDLKAVVVSDREEQILQDLRFTLSQRWRDTLGEGHQA